MQCFIIIMEFTQIIKRRYDSFMVRIVNGTNSPITVRMVHGTTGTKSTDGTNSPGYEEPKVRIVHEPQMGYKCGST